MDLRRELNKKIERKQADIADWTREKNEREAKIREGQAYIAALNEALKLLPKEMASDAAKALRPESSVFKAREAILKAGKALHISVILGAIGKPVNHDTKAALSGSIATYVRKGEIFTRSAPNTFGLRELEQDGSTLEEEPPPGFGKMNGAKPSHEDEELGREAEKDS